MAETNLPEEWRPVADFPDYEVSDFGRIKRVNLTSRAGHRLRPNPRGGTNNGSGYLFVNLHKDGAPHTRRVHQLVCEAFHGPRPSPLHVVAHNDGTQVNNRADNLRWTTPAGNSLDRSLHGRAAKKLIPEQIRLIRKSPLDGEALGKLLGVSGSAVRYIRRRDSWAWLE